MISERSAAAIAAVHAMGGNTEQLTKLFGSHWTTAHERAEMREQIEANNWIGLRRTIEMINARRFAHRKPVSV